MYSTKCFVIFTWLQEKLEIHVPKTCCLFLLMNCQILMYMVDVCFDFWFSTESENLETAVISSEQVEICLSMLDSHPIPFFCPSWEDTWDLKSNEQQLIRHKHSYYLVQQFRMFYYCGNFQVKISDVLWMSDEFRIERYPVILVYAVNFPVSLHSVLCSVATLHYKGGIRK